MIAEVSVPRPQTTQASDQRKFAPRDSHPRRIEISDDGVWHIHGYDEARQILRSELMRQAGFQADLIGSQKRNVLKSLPILYLEGEEHHRMRRETNRFFTPTVTDQRYREFMDAFADTLIED